MKTNPGVAAQMFETLAAEGVNIEMISTSTIRISCVVAEDDVERAVRALHAAFELEQRERARWERARVGLVGATGLVGTEMLRLFESRNFPVGELRAFASPRSEGRKLPFAGSGRRGCVSGAARRLLRRSRPRGGRRRRPHLAGVVAPGGRRRCAASSTSRPRSAWSPTYRS